MLETVLSHLNSFPLDTTEAFWLSFADEANQITEYADETDLWGSEDEANRVNDYGLN